MEQKMNCVFHLSLKEAALRKFIITMWKETDILSLFELGSYDSIDDLFGDLLTKMVKGQNRIESRLSGLELPNTLLENDATVYLVQQVGFEIFNWIMFHEVLLNRIGYPSLGYARFDRRFLEKLCWTSVGTVNYRDTAAELIRCEMLTVDQCYILAGLYCLEDYIPVTWEKFQKTRVTYQSCLFQITEPHLDAFWDKLLGYESRVPIANATSFYQYAFEKAALMGNKYATEYFYEKLTTEESEISLFKTAEQVTVSGLSLVYSEDSHELPNNKLPDVFVYLLSLLNTEQQMELLQKHPYQVLMFLLQWPWSHHFLDFGERALKFLSFNEYKGLLLHMHGTWNMDLFKKYYLLSPVDNQISFIAQEPDVFRHFLYSLFYSGDTSTVSYFYKEIASSKLTSVAFCDVERGNCSFYDCRICCRLTPKMRLEFLKLYIRETNASDDEREKIKSRFQPGFFEISAEDYEQLFERPANTD